MKTQSSPRHGRKTGCVVILIVFLGLLVLGYVKCLHTTARVFTRENTALESLPPGVDIPIMADGVRVDYVRAYELIYPEFRASREDNAMRDVARFMGSAIVFWDNYGDPSRTQPPTLEEMLAKFAFSGDVYDAWCAYCEKLNLSPAELKPYAGLVRAAPPNNVIAQRKYAQWKKTQPAESAENAGEAADADALPEEETAPVYDLPDSAEAFPVPDEILAKLAKEEETDELTVFTEYYKDRFNRPWTAAEFPEMAQWLEYHAPMLDVFTAAVRREVFNIPFYRNNEQAQLMGSLLYDAAFFRQVARMLSWRTNLAITQGDAVAAMADTETIWRLGRHVTHQPQSLIVHLIGITLESMAKDATVTLLAANIATPEQLRELSAMIHSLPAEASLMDIMTVESFYAQEYVDLLPSGKFGDYMLDNKINVPLRTALDPNYLADHYAILRKEFQQCVATGELDKLEEQVDSMTANLRWLRLSTFGVRKRSELAADIIYCLMAPAVSPVLQGKQQVQRNQQLLYIAIALKLYQAQHGEYPETLAALTPTYLTTLPAMPEAEKYPLSYHRKDSGFILTAVETDFDPESEDEFSDKYRMNYRNIIKMSE